MHPAPIEARRAGPSSRSLGWLALAWLLLNAALLWIYYEPALKPLIGDEFDYNRRALALLAGHPLPEAFIWPPGQTWFIASIYALFGTHVLAVQCVQIVLLATCAGMLARLWQPLAGARAAFWAAALFLLNPSTLAYAQWLWPEVTHLACLLGALLLLRGDRPPVWRGFAAGALIGLALLFKSLLGAFWPLLLLVFVVRRQRARWQLAWPFACAFVLGVLATSAPALWKGYVETGRPLIADSSVYNLYVGLADRSRSDYIDEAGGAALQAFIASSPLPQQRNAIYLDKIAASVAERGVANVLLEQFGTQYFRLFNAKTLLVSQLPGRACDGRLGAYATSTATPWLVTFATITHASTLVLAAFGIAMWRRWRQPFIVFIAAFVLYQLVLYAGLHVMQRYLFQMLPFLCVFGGSVIARRGESGHGNGALVASPLRLALGGMLAAALLALAFLGPVLDGACAAAQPAPSGVPVS